MTFRDCSGRHTVFDKGVPGFVLTKNNIEELIDITESQKEKYFGMLERAQIHNQTLLLIQGRVCALDEKDFDKCDAPKIYPVPNLLF